jgi:energy-coupling factor transporter ATP-binding protein EcfA2
MHYSNSGGRTLVHSHFSTLRILTFSISPIANSGSPEANVVVFGETGSGKSSVINMLPGVGEPGSGSTAKVSSSATSVTNENARYIKVIEGKIFHIYDTVGLHDISIGRISAMHAVEGLHALISELCDGVNLLVFVMRAPRITIGAQQSYNLLYDAICDKKVPVVIVVTGLEDEVREQWWSENRELFDCCDMLFAGHACITALTDMRVRYDYEQSKMAVARLIYDSYTRKAWKMPEMSWFAAVVAKVLSIFGIQSSDFNSTLYALLNQYGGLTEKEAKALAERMPRRRKPGWFKFWSS